jgi:hypothetical protein
MKIHSLKLTIQDVPDKKGKLFAAVFGTVVVDTGEVSKDKDGKDRLDEDGNPVPVLEDIQTIVPLNANPEFKSHVQAFLIEALTLKNLEIAEENGQISHFLEAVGGGNTGGKKKKGSNFTKAKKKKK